MPRRQVTIKQGATWSMSFRVRDDGVDRDLTGWSARMQVRATHAATTTLLSLSSPASGITIEAALGRVTLTATAVQTAGLPAPTVAAWDCELVSPSGAVTRILEGVARITPEVTR